ncbi:TPA: ATP synthase F1 subunit gamma [Candidatus Poribacteria bacterium]|nr:ATP synthase F1 subunit gamma [Candidatus Poribacteria bacterium]HIM12386.1 ATP synthase F1 subunit gamma [Candidatus Poribacteria bacterium]
MATLREIRRRIASVTKISQVTDAMRMVATAKLRRAQEAIEANRPYAEKFDLLLGHLLAQIDIDEVPHLFLVPHEMKSVCLVAVSSDRGLCGGFNANIVKASNKRIGFYTNQGFDVSLICVGRRVADSFRKREHRVIAEYLNPFQTLRFETAIDIVSKFDELYLEKQIDKVEVIYNNFRSAITQNVLVEQLLPLTPNPPTGDDLFWDYLYEPTQSEIFERVLSKHLNIQTWKVLLDSHAAEHAARMTAMENATSNAKEIIDELILQRNRARQAIITKEISEIVGGAEALG